MTNTGVGHGPFGNVGRGASAGNGLALELAEKAGVSAVHGAGTTESVEMAGAAEVGLALSVGVGIRGAEESAVLRLDDGVNVLEDVALSEDVAALADLEGVAVEVVEEVVDLVSFVSKVQSIWDRLRGIEGRGPAYGVEESVALDLGHTTAQVVEVVAHKSHHVVGAVEVHTPVVVSVASSGPVGAAVNQVVRDSNAVVGLGTENNVLATNTGSSDVINPDEIGIVDSDGITAPNVLGVDIGDSDVLDDDVLGTADHANTLTLDSSSRALSDERLVRVDGDTENTGLVTARMSQNETGIGSTEIDERTR